MEVLCANRGSDFLNLLNVCFNFLYASQFFPCATFNLSWGRLAQTFKIISSVKLIYAGVKSGVIELIKIRNWLFCRAIVLHKANLLSIGAYCLCAKVHVWQMTDHAERWRSVDVYVCSGLDAGHHGRLCERPLLLHENGWDYNNLIKTTAHHQVQLGELGNLMRLILSSCFVYRAIYPQDAKAWQSCNGFIIVWCN